MEASTRGSSPAAEKQPEESEIRIDLSPVDHLRPAAEIQPEESEAREDLPPVDHDLCRKLYHAASEGDWETTKRILRQHPHAVRAPLDESGETLLHIAAAVRDNGYFVWKLLKRLGPDDVILQRADDNTALCIAAVSGSVEVAELLVNKDTRLPMMRGKDGVLPVSLAAMFGHRSMLQFLFAVTDFDKLSDSERFDVFIYAIHVDFYEEALDILQEFPDLAIHQEADRSALQVLARKHLKSHHALLLMHMLWREITEKGYECVLHLMGSPSQLLLDAAEVRNFWLMTLLTNSYPDLRRKVFEDGQTLCHIAILTRQDEVFNEIGAVRDVIANYTDKKQNNTLHLAAKLPKPIYLNNSPGEALQMQRELLWYKEMESILPMHFREMKNKFGDTPQSLFNKEHEALRVKGQAWMQRTAQSYILVATLIVTVTFAAAFTVPGGNDQLKGTPIFQRSRIFVIFAVADAISFFLSCITIMICLDILNSRYAIEDFRTVLPRKLLGGLSAIFFSITFMMVAFASTFFIIFKASISWLPIPIIVAIFAAIPVLIFASFQYPLLADIYRSTYRTRHLFHPKKYRVRGKKNIVSFIKRPSAKYVK